MKQRLEGIISYELVVIHKCLLYACIITVAYICSTQYLEVCNILNEQATNRNDYDP